MKAGYIFVKYLENEGVEAIFRIPGAAAWTSWNLRENVVSGWWRQADERY